MKKYKYIRVRRSILGVVYYARVNGKKKYPRDVINELAERGYEFKGMVPVSNYAQALYEYDMVFETDANANIVYDVY